MMISIRKKNVHITLENVLSTICFLAGIAFLLAALFGIWRHFLTMGLCIAVGIMITDKSPDDDTKERRHNQ